MTRDLLSVYQPDGTPPPSSVDLEQIGRDLDALNQEIKAAGAWVFSGGLHFSTTATVVRLVDKRATLLQASTMLEEAALDKYTFTRDSYLQRRRSVIYDGNPPEEDVTEPEPAQ